MVTEEATLWRVVAPAPAHQIQSAAVTVPVYVSKPVLRRGDVAVHTGADDVAEVDEEDVDDEEVV